MTLFLPKQCSKCGLVKSPDKFGKDMFSQTGLRSICYACMSAIAKAWYYKNRDKIAADRVVKTREWMRRDRDAPKSSAKGRPARQLIDGKLLCPKCQEWKVLDAFYKTKCVTYARSSYCKLCHNAESARRRHAKSNRPKGRPIRPLIDGKLLCSKCKEWKVLDAFDVDNGTIQGRASYCKVCRRARQKRSRQAIKIRKCSPVTL